MFVHPRRINSAHLILTALAVCLFLSGSCKSIKSNTASENSFKRFSISEAKFDLGDTEKFEFEIINFGAAIDERFLIQYRKKEKVVAKDLGRFFRVSEDGGETFGKEYEIKKLIPQSEERSVGFYFFSDGISAVLIENTLIGKEKRRNLFYTRSDNTNENWSKPTRINDEENSVVSGCHPVHVETNVINCAWTDMRSGTGQVYFSRSSDGGKSWKTNQPIERDLGQSAQQLASFSVGANGRLLAFWDDWRDEKTLADVRFSYSDDGGETWIPSIKINDDEKAVWQLGASAVAEGEHILVAFTDFREKGVEGDKDWNVYYARSEDNGASWEPNKRLNDVKIGRQGAVRLTKDNGSGVYAEWITAEKTIFGQLAFSHSNDFGESWSPALKLTDEKSILDPAAHSLVPTGREGRFISGWFEETLKARIQRLSIIELTTEDSLVESSKVETENSVQALEYIEGDKLFSDDFSSSQLEKQWDPIAGVWVLVNGTYMASRPVEPKSSISLAKFSEPEKYILKGRFKLDKVTHENADIYLRFDKNESKYLVIKNRFRYGSWLSLKEAEVQSGLDWVGGKVLAQKAFPFRSDRWYGFKLIVTNEQIDYYVDERLMVSFAGRIDLPPGRFGLGGWARSPAYFDDISVFALK